MVRPISSFGLSPLALSFHYFLTFRLFDLLAPDYVQGLGVCLCVARRQV